MLTSRFAGVPSAWWSVAYVGGAITLLAITANSAWAGTVVDFSCVGAKMNFNCVAQWATAGDPYVRQVPEPLDAAAKAQAAARDRNWVKRCRPVIEQDRFGVGRYHYSAAGCEFGIGAD